MVAWRGNLNKRLKFSDQDKLRENSVTFREIHRKFVKTPFPCGLQKKSRKNQQPYQVDLTGQNEDGLQKVLRRDWNIGRVQQLPSKKMHARRFFLEFLLPIPSDSWIRPPPLPVSHRIPGICVSCTNGAGTMDKVPICSPQLNQNTRMTREDMIPNGCSVDHAQQSVARCSVLH